MQFLRRKGVMQCALTHKSGENWYIKIWLSSKLLNFQEQELSAPGRVDTWHMVYHNFLFHQVHNDGAVFCPLWWQQLTLYGNYLWQWMAITAFWVDYQVASASSLCLAVHKVSFTKVHNVRFTSHPLHHISKVTHTPSYQPQVCVTLRAT